jgi:iron complex transport system ATP-binding protein
VSAVLEGRGLTAHRGRRQVLSGVDLELAPGEALAVVGPNAAGKSTLLRALAGLLPLTSGNLVIGGRARHEWRRDALARFLALVTPEDEGGSPLPVYERVAMGRYPHTGPFVALRASDHAAVERALTLTGILPLRDRQVRTLSAGERQLAAVSRGLAQEPRVLLLDEPASHLDVGHQLALFRVLDQVRSEGVAVLAVVHDLQRAADWADRLLLVAEGHVVAAGAPRAVLASREAAAAFAVDIAEHPAPPRPGPLYSFKEQRQ